MQSDSITLPHLYNLLHDSKCAIKELYIKQTQLKDIHGNRLNFRGLFCSKTLHEGDFIGMYNGKWQHEEYALDDNTSKYTIGMSHGMNVFPLSTNPKTYPIAMANEPPEHFTANATMTELVFDREDISDIPGNVKDQLFFGLALIACTQIEAHTEITWFYGPHYSNLRTYAHGQPCSTTKLQGNPVNVLGHRLPYDAVSPFIESPSNSDSDDKSDDEWRPKTWPAEKKVKKIKTI